jgi:hypothetical protein
MLLFTFTDPHACTTAIVSGKFTPDGRPLLFKHRDTSFEQNKLMYFNDGRYAYIGLVNSADPDGREVWAGFNSAGFAIINSESYNLNVGDTTRLRDMEGVLMKKALQQCATVEEFAEFLDNFARPRGVRANFGVIDARGGAAYFETGNTGFRKIDVNDQTVAPFGFVIRTNFSATGVPDAGYGYIRYENAERLFGKAAAAGTLSYRFILQEVSRSLYHSMTGVDLSRQLPAGENTEFVFFEDFIPRNSSVATTVIQGVLPDEPAGLTTMWTIPGFQLCTIALPVWITDGGALPQVAAAGADGIAPLCDLGLQLKDRCFPVKRGSGKRYLNLTAVMNQEGTGILQKIMPLENSVLARGADLLKGWRANGFSGSEAVKFYNWLDEIIPDEYMKLFGIYKK